MVANVLNVSVKCGVLVLAMLAFAVQPLDGATIKNTRNGPVILYAAEDTDTGDLEIHGTGLIIEEECPEIIFGGTKITDCLPTIDDVTGMHSVIIPLWADIEDGTHLLMLTTKNGATQFGVTLGAAGPRGEDGYPRSKIDLYSLGSVSTGQYGITTVALESTCGDTEDIAIGGRCAGPEGASLSGAGTDGNSALIQPSVNASFKCAWTKAPTLTGTFLAIVDCIDVDADTIPSPTSP